MATFWETLVHPQFYNLTLALLPHLFLLGLIPCCLYQIQALMVENIFMRAFSALVVALILYMLTQKSLRINHSDKKIKKVTTTVTEEIMDKMLQSGDDVVDRILERSASLGVRRPIQYTNPETYEHVQHLPEFQQLQKQLQTIPHWVDHERIGKAAAFYRDNVALVFIGLSIGLVESYTFPEDAKVCNSNINFPVNFLEFVF